MHEDRQCSRVRAIDVMRDARVCVCVCVFKFALLDRTPVTVLFSGAKDPVEDATIKLYCWHGTYTTAKRLVTECKQRLSHISWSPS